MSATANYQAAVHGQAEELVGGSVQTHPQDGAVSYSCEVESRLGR